MTNVQAILLVAVAVLVAVAFFLWRRIAALEESVRTERATSEDRRAEAEKARADTRTKVAEVDQLKKQLQDTRAKLKRQEKQTEGGGSKKSRASAPAAEPPASESAAAVVRVSNKEVEAEAERRLTGLRKELEAAQAKIVKLEQAEARRKAEIEKAKASLASEAPEAAAAAPAEGAAPEQQVAALETQLTALKDAARGREKDLERQLRKLEGRERASTRRANNNHALYQLIKGQLDLAEDKVALLRRKYEGAKKPESLKADPVPADEVAAALADEATQEAEEAAKATADAATEAAAEAAPEAAEVAEAAPEAAEAVVAEAAPEAETEAEAPAETAEAEATKTAEA
ncbi:MAG: hypothetical protein H6730_16475 [Deltaproteobacteria bacterium]|nr:hypothetical protein [Deltaproteobacteria bacterium]